MWTVESSDIVMACYLLRPQLFHLDSNEWLSLDCHRWGQCRWMEDCKLLATNNRYRVSWAQEKTKVEIALARLWDSHSLCRWTELFRTSFTPPWSTFINSYLLPLIFAGSWSPQAVVPVTSSLPTARPLRAPWRTECSPTSLRHPQHRSTEPRMVGVQEEPEEEREIQDYTALGCPEWRRMMINWGDDHSWRLFTLMILLILSMQRWRSEILGLDNSNDLSLISLHCILRSLLLFLLSLPAQVQGAYRYFYIGTIRLIYIQSVYHY